MAESDSAPWRSRPAPQAVAASTGGSTFGVQCSGWDTLVPALPAEVAGLLAPPVSVSSAPLNAPPPVDPRRRADLARFRLNMASVPPYGRHRRPARAG